MQKKLLYSGALCALFSASTMIFGMDLKNLDPNFTALAYYKKGNPEEATVLAAFHPKGTKTNSLDFITNSTRESASSTPCYFIITDADDGSKILSVINHTDRETINFGQCDKKLAKVLLKGIRANTIGLFVRKDNKKHFIDIVQYYNQDNGTTDTITLTDDQNNAATDTVTLTDIIKPITATDTSILTDDQNNATLDAIIAPDINNEAPKAPVVIIAPDTDDSTLKATHTINLSDAIKQNTNKKTNTPIIQAKSRWILGIGILAVLSSLYYFLKIRTA